MTYNKRRYRRVHVAFPITRTRVRGTKLTLSTDGLWSVNAQELWPLGFNVNRPLAVAFESPDRTDSDSRWHRENGPVRVRSYPSFSPNDFLHRRVPFDERFSRFPHFRVPA